MSTQASKSGAPATSRTLAGAAIALCAVAALGFAGAAVHELNYASAHPFAYGPAKVIATASGSGALLCVAVGLLAVAMSHHLARADGTP
jgi:cation transporter-like permease